MFFTREIAWRAGGSFWLVSGDGLLGITRAQENGSTRVYRKVNRWDGTLATIHLPENSNSDFGDILAICHQLVQNVERDAIKEGLEFVDESAEFPEDAEVIGVSPIQNHLDAAHATRTNQLLPAISRGSQVVLDFDGVRVLSTSVAQALLGEVLRTPGSLTKLVFRNCMPATKAAIRTSAALAKAAYRMRPE